MKIFVVLLMFKTTSGIIVPHPVHAYTDLQTCTTAAYHLTNMPLNKENDNKFECKEVPLNVTWWFPK